MANKRPKPVEIVAELARDYLILKESLGFLSRRPADRPTLSGGASHATKIRNVRAPKLSSDECGALHAAQ